MSQGWPANTECKQAETALEERNRHIQLLYETTRDLLSTEQPLTLVETVFARLKCLINLDVYFNYWLDEGQQQLHLLFYGGISDEIAKSIEWLDVGCAVCGTVAQQRRQIVQFDLQHSTDPKTKLIRDLGLTAYSCQPLVAQGKLFGTLGFGSRSRTRFTEAETSLFQTLCDQIAIALERADLVASLQQQTTELVQAHHLKDEFLAALSHELRTPLNPILGWTKLMQNQKLTTAQTTEALNTIERNVKQQILLVDDLLDMSSVIQGNFNLNFYPVDLTTTLNQALEAIRFAAQAKRITIDVTQPEAQKLSEPPLLVMGDPDRLRQIFWNLLSNAVKFTPEDGQITLETGIVTSALPNHTAQIRVIDNGIGIAPPFLPHVFDHFRQADGSSTRKYGGLGLGLSIVRHLIELQGGTVKAESAGSGQGATFTVQLPLCLEVRPSLLSTTGMTQMTQQDSLLPPELIFTSTLTGIQILLVDDDPDNLDLLQFLLQQKGAVVTALTSPVEALRVMTHDCPDLIISDIGMPGMNGYEFIQQVRTLPQCRQIPALAFTAFAQPETQEEVLAAGFQAYLPKPVDPLQFLAAVQQFSTRLSTL
jgi:signal transduction histidine kinase/ActR/RegA family two-component response regulator